MTKDIINTWQEYIWKYPDKDPNLIIKITADDCGVNENMVLKTVCNEIDKS